MKKSKAYLAMVPDEKSRSTLTTINKDDHRVKRKVVAQASADKALREFEPTLQKHIDDLCSSLGESRDYDKDGWTEGKSMDEHCRCSWFPVIHRDEC